MVNFKEWDGFEGRLWKEEINVRDFIQNNYTPYDGDESFLEGPTEATDKLWGKLQELQKEERAKGGVLDMFFFSFQELLDIECVLGVIVGGVLAVRVLGQVVLVAQKRAHTPQLQDALAAIQHRQFIPAHKFFATMSSGEFKKEIGRAHV